MWPFKKKKYIPSFPLIEFTKLHLIFSDSEKVIMSNFDWMPPSFKIKEKVSWGKNEYTIDFIKHNGDNIYIFLKLIEGNSEKQK